MCEMKILLNCNSILQVGIEPTAVALQSQLCAPASRRPLIFIQGGSVSAPFTGTAYRVKYFKPIPKEFNQDISHSEQN